MKQLRWRIEAGALVLASVPLSLLPVRAGEVIGLLLYRLWRSRRGIAVENLRRSDVSPLLRGVGPDEVIRQHFRHIGRSFLEVIKVYYGRGERIVGSIAIEGMEHLGPVRAAGTGALFITGHCGNWELLPLAFSSRVQGVAVVARPLNNPYLNRLLEQARERYGNRVIYKRGAVREILRALGRGEYVGILMDQAVLPEEGCVIDFLGRPAWTSKVPALIARKADVPVFPVFIRREGSGHVITIQPAIRLSEASDQSEATREDTARFSAAIEKYIREHPAEWLWIHRRWKRAGDETAEATERRTGAAA